MLAHIAFALYAPDGRFGVVKYRFDTGSAGDLPARNDWEEMCVADDRMMERGSDGPDTYKPPCPDKYRPVPVSVNAWMSADTMDSNVLTLNVRPTEADYDRMVLIREPPPKPETLPLIAPQPSSTPAPMTPPVIARNQEPAATKAPRTQQRPLSTQSLSASPPRKTSAPVAPADSRGRVTRINLGDLKTAGPYLHVTYSYWEREAQRTADELAKRGYSIVLLFRPNQALARWEVLVGPRTGREAAITKLELEKLGHKPSYYEDLSATWK